MWIELLKKVFLLKIIIFTMLLPQRLMKIKNQFFESADDHIIKHLVMRMTKMLFRFIDSNFGNRLLEYPGCKEDSDIVLTMLSKSNAT